MKLSGATSLFILCALTLLATAPTGIVAQRLPLGPAPGPAAPGHDPAAPGDTTTAAATTTTPKVTTTSDPTTTVSHTTPPTTTTTAPVVPTSTAAPVKTTVATPSVSAKTTTSVVLPTSTAPTNGTSSTCLSSADCTDGLLCQLAVSGSPTGVCGPMPARFFCKATPPQDCVITADCKNPAYSICRPAPDLGNRNVCAGLGDPILSPCTQTDSNSDDGSVKNTLTYAGIGVGSVAALAVAFALVRWQRRRQRSKIPENMFGEVDYGMTDRSTTKAEPYAFSSRAAAQGSETYEDNYYQGGAGGGGGGGGGYNKDQYYDDQHYGHDGYGNGGGYGHGGHGGHNDGFYDNPGYDDYSQQPAAPARAMSPRGGDYQMDHYGVEPSEMGYGGNGHGHGGHGGHAGGGYDRY